nr:hypothetical protein [Bilophila wadsworthia]
MERRTFRRTAPQHGGRAEKRHWKIQHGTGLSFVTVGDFSFCDFLDLTIALGTVTYIFRNVGSAFDTYFVMTRGDGSRNIPVMEMTKWLNTKCHYIVLELSSNQTFQPSLEWLENDDALAGQLGFHAKPVLPGPITNLPLSKDKTEVS